MAKEETFCLEIGTFEGLCTKVFGTKNKIFFGELIRNSIHSLKKIRPEISIDKSNLDAEPQLFIRIVPDKTNNTLSIIDSGIGMTKDDLEDQLCSLDNGAGFWSAFLVAEKVVVTTKHNDDEQYVWESSQGGHSFTITKDTTSVGDSRLARGTKITLFLKEDQLEYLDVSRLQYLVGKLVMVIPSWIYFSIEECIEKVKTEHVCIQNYPSPIWVEISDRRTLTDEEKAKKKQVSFEEKKQQFESLHKLIEKVLGNNKVQKVVVSDNIKNDLPCCMSRDPELKKITIEINPDDPMVEELRKLADADKDSQVVEEKIWCLYEVYHAAFIWYPETFIPNMFRIDDDDDDDEN